jgi:hypothetical protein
MSNITKSNMVSLPRDEVILDTSPQKNLPAYWILLADSQSDSNKYALKPDGFCPNNRLHLAF